MREQKPMLMHNSLPELFAGMSEDDISLVIVCLLSARDLVGPVDVLEASGLFIVFSPCARTAVRAVSAGHRDCIAMTASWTCRGNSGAGREDKRPVVLACQPCGFHGGGSRFKLEGGPWHCTQESKCYH